MEDCVSDAYNASVIVDLKGDRQCHTSNTVNVKNQKQTVNKGKNVVHLFTGGAMPDPLHESELKNSDNGDLNCFKPIPSAEETLTCTNFDKGFMGDTVGDNVTFDVLSEEKYSLEMNTTCKSDRLCLARGAMGNKKFLAQNKQFFGFIPIYGLHSRIEDTSTNSVCTDILALHKLLHQDGRHNYEGLQVPAHSQLDFVKWKSYLQDYWD